MRYHALLYAIILPAAISAQSPYVVGSGIAHPTGVPPGGNSTRWSNHTSQIFPTNASKNASAPHFEHTSQPSTQPSGTPLEPTTNVTEKRFPTFASHSSAATAPPTQATAALYINVTESISVQRTTASVSGKPHKPLTRGSSAFFGNSTAEPPKPSGTGIPAKLHGTGISSGFPKPSEHSSYTPIPISSAAHSSGRLPISKGSGSHFTNSTTGGYVAPPASSVNHRFSATVVSSGFALPTAAGEFTKSSNEPTTSPTARVPYTPGTGSIFTNNASGVAQPTGKGNHGLGTGVSSGFAQPSTGPHYVSGYVTRPLIISGRLPYTKSTGLVFLNSTATIIPTENSPTAYSTGVYPIGVSRIVSGILYSTGHSLYIKPTGPLYTNGTSGHALPTGPSGAFPTAPFLTGVSSHGVIPTPSGRLPYTKSTGFVFTNSTSSNPAIPTQIFSSGGLPTAPPATGAFSTGVIPTIVPTGIFPSIIRSSNGIPHSSGHLPYTKSTALSFTNSTTIAKATSPSETPGAFPTKPFSSPLFTTGTGYPSFTTPVAPVLNSTASTKASAFSIIPTGIPSSHGIPIATGLPFTKSSGPLFTNSTAVAVPTLSTSFLPTGTAYPSLTTSISSLNSTSRHETSSTASPVLTTSSRKGRPHHPQTVTVTITASPSTITVGGTTITTTDFVTATPSSIVSLAPSSSGSFVEETTTVYVTASASSSVYLPTTLVTRVLSASSGFASSTGTIASASASSSSTAVPIPEYYQCGGLNYKGSGICAKGTVCKKWNPYYSQCVDERYA